MANSPTARPRGARHVLGVFVGTGVGGGLILNGELFTGYNGNAGELGHLILHWRQGTDLESIAGRKHMMKRAKEILDDAPKRVRKEWKGVELAGVRSAQLAEYYQKDDPVAIQLVDDAARALARRSAVPSTSSVPKSSSSAAASPALWETPSSSGSGKSPSATHCRAPPTASAASRPPWETIRASSACAAYAKTHPPIVAAADVA